jgi:hypothetical protein
LAAPIKNPIGKAWLARRMKMGDEAPTADDLKKFPKEAPPPITKPIAWKPMKPPALGDEDW